MKNFRKIRNNKKLFSFKLYKYLANKEDYKGEEE